MKRSHLFVLAAGLLGFGLSWWLFQLNWFEGLERQAQDAHLRRARAAWSRPGSSTAPAARGETEVWPGPGDKHSVVIVAIDERTFADAHADDADADLRGLRWPFPPRLLHAFLKRMIESGADRVGFTFPWPGRAGATQAELDQLTSKIESSGLPVVFAEPPGALVSPYPTGSAALEHDLDDVVRRFRLQEHPDGGATAASDPGTGTEGADAPAPVATAPRPHDSLALALVRAKNGDPGLQERGWLRSDGTVDPAIEDTRIFWAGPPGTFPKVSFSDVLRGSVTDDVLTRFGVPSQDKLFEGMTVLVGVTWPGWVTGPTEGTNIAWGVKTPWYATEEAIDRIVALHGASASSNVATRMPTVEVHANLVQMLYQPRREVQFTIADQETNTKLLAVACLVMVLAVALLPPLASASVLVVLVGGTLFGTNELFKMERTLFGSMAPVAGACITYAFGMVASWLAERREKRYIQGLFGKYVSKEVANQIARSREAPKLGGERRELTVLFSDIAGFTSWSEQLGPEQLLVLLNEYLGAMTDVVFDKNGTLDKYIGDSVMAFWNAPMQRKDHAARACEAALEMRSQLADLNQAWLATGLKPLGMRIGVNSGECVVGNAGSGQRFDYTVFGDNVNLASRLEGTCKFYGISIAIAAATYKAAGGPDRFAARHIDRVRVVGRTKPVDIFELISTRKELDQDPDLTRFLNAFASGVKAYFERDWPNSSHAFMNAQKMRPEDGPTRVFLTRIQRFSRQAPPDNWDGSVELPVK